MLYVYRCPIDGISKKDPADTVEQALDTDLEKYQRPAETSRLDEISTWFGDSGNYIVNSGLVWLPNMGPPLPNLGAANIGHKRNLDRVPSSGDAYDRIVAEFPL